MDSMKSLEFQRKVVISQSMYFPWAGILEQIKLADVFVHYDDVQFARGFYNRVQIKTPHGIKWLTVPLRDRHRGQKIDETLVDNRTNWRDRHRELLRFSYRNSPYRDDMLQLVDEVFSKKIHYLSDVSRTSTLAIADYFRLSRDCFFADSRSVGIKGRSSQRLKDITSHFKGRVYITGHGARNYLDHELFENSDIEVRYMDYKINKYSQLYGEFTPFVSALDLIANCGTEGIIYLDSTTMNWRQFIQS